ncbi:GntR family transcriptional regulator [Mesorhizobium kowhaii]|uniref:GntR family transcriptional regulator n=1 Tax=Mesorhizobium kowhaii TaxID=1300272 RepID=UPI0035F08183
MSAKNPRKAAVAFGEGTRLSDVAYGRIFDILYDRRLPAGAFVSQAQLVELTGVPVGPLRDALRALQAEGVVTIHPHAGIQFVKPGMELTRSTYQFRGIIEAAAVAVFAETARDGEIAELALQHRDVAAALEGDGLTHANMRELEKLEELLHGSIVASLNNPLIDTSYRRIRNYLRLLRLDRKMSVPLALRSLREHQEIIEACRKRDASGAVEAIKTHFAAALQRNLGLY